MIIVTVELCPGGNKEQSKTIGRMDIINTCTGSVERGNYKVRLWRRCLKRVLYEGEVLDYPRLSYTVWELVKRALKVLS